MEGWIWVLFIAIAIVAELLTDQLIAIWFVPGAIISIILDFLSVDVLWQIAAFLVISAIGVFVSQKYLRKFAL